MRKKWKTNHSNFIDFGNCWRERYRYRTSMKQTFVVKKCFDELQNQNMFEVTKVSVESGEFRRSWKSLIDVTRFVEVDLIERVEFVVSSQLSKNVIDYYLIWYCNELMWKKAPSLITASKSMLRTIEEKRQKNTNWFDDN